MENLVLNFYTIIFFFISYFVGSIPFGYLIYKLKYNDDIRKHGSGNIGATNVNRLLRKKLGLLTLFFDFLKTFSICIIITHFYGSELGGVCGVFSILGHIFPVWLKFKGGKGVATYLGVILALSYKFFFIFVTAWISLSLLFRFASLSSMISTLIVFLYAYFYEINNSILILFIFFVMILFTHKENILRLKSSTENKIKL